MGVARFGGEKLRGFNGEAINDTLQAAGRTFTFTFVDVGNPHCVIRSPWPLEILPLHEIGPEIEEHRYFPRKANVEFYVLVDEHYARIRVWERGVGETRACGTGATATAVALVRTGRCAESRDGRAARRALDRARRQRLARLHDRSGRRDLPRRPLARVPGAPRVASHP